MYGRPTEGVQEKKACAKIPLYPPFSKGEQKTSHLICLWQMLRPKKRGVAGILIYTATRIV
jgi:hypothetical protein